MTNAKAPAQFSVEYIVKLVVCTLVYLVVVSAIPVHNNWVLKGFTYNDHKYTKYNYPLTLTFFQTLGTAVVLLFYSIAKHYLWDQRNQNNKYDNNGLLVAPVRDSSLLDENLLNDSENSVPEKSWILGPNFLKKCYYIGPVGVIFGLKLCATNWGLQEVPITIHLLLQSSSLLWTTIFSWFFLGETLNLLEALAIAGTVVGTVFISLDFSDIQTSGGAAFPLILNLSSCVLEGASITTLRWATSIVSHKKVHYNPIDDAEVPENYEDINHEKNTGFDMDSFEFTCIKLFMSALTALPLFLLLEVIDVANRYTNSHSSLVALNNVEPLVVILMVLTGSILTLAFQVNITMFCVFATSITVGLVGDIKIIPQTLTSILFQGQTFEWNSFHISGLVIIFVSIVAYTVFRYMRHTREHEEKHRNRNINKNNF